MNRTIKVLLAVLTGLLVICMCGAGAVFAAGLWAVDQALELADHVTDKPQEIAQYAQRIAQYELPADFDRGFALDVLGVTLVGYNGRDGRSHIFLAQLVDTPTLSVDEMKLQVNLALKGNHYTWLDQEMTFVDSYVVTVMGQPAVASVGEGVDYDGMPYRQVMVAFEGGAGPAMVLYSAPISTWDQETVDRFLTSLH